MCFYAIFLGFQYYYYSNSINQSSLTRFYKSLKKDIHNCFGVISRIYSDEVSFVSNYSNIKLVHTFRQDFSVTIPYQYIIEVSDFNSCAGLKSNHYNPCSWWFVTVGEFRSVVKDTKSNTKHFTKSISIHSDYQSVHFW